MKVILNYKIGIIGYGNFAKVIAQHLFPNNTLFVYSRHINNDELTANASAVTTIQELVEKSDIIIPAIPIRQCENVIKEISQFVKPNQIVMDICSVKEYPVKIMKEYLQDKANLIATHPMFGPNSIKHRNNQLQNLHLVISNINTEQTLYDNVAQYFKNLGLQVIEMSPEEHDRLSARSQFFAMMIGQFAQKLELKPTVIDTPGASAIFDALAYMGPDLHIIEDMLMYNVYCKTVLENMIATLENLQKQS